MHSKYPKRSYFTPENELPRSKKLRGSKTLTPKLELSFREVPNPGAAGSCQSSEGLLKDNPADGTYHIKHLPHQP
jgi:hypothetical protein